MRIAYQQLDLNDKETRDRLFDDLFDAAGDDVVLHQYLEDLQVHADGQDTVIEYYEDKFEGQDNGQ